MRILQIIDSLSIGGAEKLIVDTVPLLIAKGYKVDVVLLNGQKTHLYRELEALDCCKIYSLGSSYYNPLYILKLIPYFYKYDVIHVHLFPAQYFVAIARLFCIRKIRLIFTEHNTENRRLNNPNFRKIERWIYNRYEKVISITEEVKDALIMKLGLEGSKIYTVENGINLDVIGNAPPLKRFSLGYNEGDKILIMVAGFREQKDQDTVIKAVSLLPGNYKLILVGDGQRKSQLKELVDTLKLQNRVNFLGVRSDVYSILKMSNIAVMSSHWEGFGLVAAESMACGIPTIASDVPGLSYVVDQGGLLFEKANVVDLVSKIRFLEDSDEYNLVSARGVQRANVFSVHSMVDKLIEIYCTEIN